MGKLSDKVRRIIAILGLIAMVVFTVSFMLNILKINGTSGIWGYVALIAAGVGIPLWFVLYADNKRRAEDEKKISGETESESDDKQDGEDGDGTDS